MQRTGLDYTAARAGLELAAVAMTPGIWTDIRIIEAGVLSAHADGADA